MLKTTETDVEYFHKVVDCQYACPAHTPVPLYIRLIGEGRYTDAYMVNRESNVFPGILGRVCDRPCEPACRRGRIEAEPVAICRLKRVASDFKEDIKDLLPKIPTQKNGKRIALIGAGPAALTVINDLMPLGYECELFEKDAFAGGAMRAQVPAFRLPQKVLDEETNYILDMGVKTHFGHEVKSLKHLIDQKFDAICIATGAPFGRDLLLPGRTEAGIHVHIGVEFLANVAFGHLKTMPKTVIVVGGGNTAMDCCRTSLRLGAEKVYVIAPEKYSEMLASPWEKLDAEKEGVEIRNLLLPKEFICKNGKFEGLQFSQLDSCMDAQRQWNPVLSSKADELIYCDAVVLAIGQNVAFPFIEKDLGMEFKKNKQGQTTAQVLVDPITYQSSIKQVFFVGDAAFGPKNIITAVADGHRVAESIDLFLQGKDPAQRNPQTMLLKSQKMALNQWSYSNDFSAALRQAVPHEPVYQAISQLSLEVEKGFDLKTALNEVKRCLNCDMQTVFKADLCIECDACIDICPVTCLTMSDNTETESDLRQQLNSPALNLSQSLYYAPVPQTQRLMVKDENICLHCGLCAERCPTGAWDMQSFSLAK